MILYLCQHYYMNSEKPINNVITMLVLLYEQ